MRRKDDTLRRTLLVHARNLADTEGIDAINMRTIAQKAGIATGTVYNYFSNKEEILLALTEEYWKQTLQHMDTVISADSFTSQLEEIFYFLLGRVEDSEGKFMNHLGSLETAGQERMASIQMYLEKTLIQRMEHDEKIDKRIWDDAFTKEQYARFVMANIMTLLKTGSNDFPFFISIVKRTLYEGGLYEKINSLCNTKISASDCRNCLDDSRR